MRPSLRRSGRPATNPTSLVATRRASTRDTASECRKSRYPEPKGASASAGGVGPSSQNRDVGRIKGRRVECRPEARSFS
eukprot:2591538-Alexandrium_andersonii.AAC.1